MEEGGEVANEKNLVPQNKRTKSEQRKIASQGGKASGESRRKRKSLKDSMNALLELPIATTRDYNKVAKMGIPVEDIDNSQLIVLALFNRAKDGDVGAWKELRDLIGEAGEQTDENALAKAREILGGVDSAF